MLNISGYNDIDWFPGIIAIPAFALFFTIFHKVVNDKIMLMFVSSDVYEKVITRKRTDIAFNRTLRINGVAFIHALMICPIALCILFDNTIAGDIQAYHRLHVWMNIILSGYFIWDCYICIRYYHIFGLLFLAHGVLSLLGSVLGTFAGGDQMPWNCAWLVLTEVSTPFLHLRWILIQVKSFGFGFQCINWIFISLYTYIRLFAVHLWGFYPLYQDTYNYFWLGQTSMINMSDLRRSIQLFIALFWTAINVLWGLILIKTQVASYYSAPKKPSDATEKKDE